MDRRPRADRKAERLLITFEGIEGSGKSSQLERLARRLRAAGSAVVTTREPGGTPLADEVRAIFLRPRAEGELPGEAELFLVLAARAIHVAGLLGPALERGELVLCDRFSDATLAYQGWGRGIDVDLIRRANALATGGVVPDRTVLLDLPVEEALERVARRHAAGGVDPDQGRLDGEHADFHRRVREGYLAIAAAEPDRVARVDATGSAALVEARVAEVARSWGALA